METHTTEPQNEMWQKLEKEHKRGKVLGGAFIVLLGIIFLAQELGVIFPAWLFTWKMLLIAIGLFIGLKHRFRNAKWLIPVIIGGVFLAADAFPDLTIKPLFWPIMIILFGLFIIFKPHRKNRYKRWDKWQKHYNKHKPYYDHKWNCEPDINNEDVLDFTAFMGGIKKNIISKNFQKGDVTVVFAGGELNFSQADFVDKAYIDVTAVFGGLKLVLPANWEIKSEVVCVFGSVEDRRPLPQSPINADSKVLILRGTVFMGGVEIKSY